MCANGSIDLSAEPNLVLRLQLERMAQVEYLQFEPLLLDRPLLCVRGRDETPSHLKRLRATGE
jgi:hypothetical protein